MDSIQQYKEAEQRVKELQAWPELDAVQQMELDRLVREMNELNEKLNNFEL